MAQTLRDVVALNHVGWVRGAGAGEIEFRQAGHPANEVELPNMGWRPVYAVNTTGGD